MKSIILSVFSLIILTVTTPVFSQSVSNYFPPDRSTMSYSIGNKLYKGVLVRSQQDSNDPTVTDSLFMTVTIGIGKTEDLYLVSRNTVKHAASINILGVAKQYPDLPVVLMLPGHSWTSSEEEGESANYTTSKASIKVGDKTYTDCILVKEVVHFPALAEVDGEKKFFYYARNVGLVYSYIESPNGKKGLVMSLQPGNN